jgi:protein-tyrosine phosphatase
LSWEEVIDYTFLADFEKFQDPTGNAMIRAWASLAAHQLLDSYNKLNRAKQEIQQLNIEILHVVTYMKDEREFLLAKEARFCQKALPSHFSLENTAGNADDMTGFI